MLFLCIPTWEQDSTNWHENLVIPMGMYWACKYHPRYKSRWKEKFFKGWKLHSWTKVPGIWAEPSFCSGSQISLFGIRVLASFSMFCIKRAPLWKIQVCMLYWLNTTGSWKHIWGNGGRIQWNGHLEVECRRLTTIEKMLSVLSLFRGLAPGPFYVGLYFYQCLDLSGLRRPLESSLIESIHSETLR